MKSRDLMVNKLYELFETYEEYIWKNEGCHLIITIDDREIVYYLSNKFDVIDKIGVSFSSKDEILFRYLAVRLFIKIFGNVMIHNNGMVIFNNSHMPYLNLIIENDWLMGEVNKMILMQEDVFINDRLPIVSSLERSLTRKQNCVKTIDLLDDRIQKTRRKLRECVK